jgi:hypothetical protein
MANLLDNVKCEWRVARVETLRSERDTVGKEREGHLYYEPVPGCHFVLYREDDKLMRTSEIEQVTARSRLGNSSVFEFETQNSKYRVTIYDN